MPAPDSPKASGVADSSSPRPGNPGRMLPLPPDEAAQLSVLRDGPDPAPLHERVALLREAGWSLQEIADAFDPPLPRSTIRSWEVAHRRASRHQLQPRSFEPDAGAPARPNRPNRPNRPSRPERAERSPAPALSPALTAEIASLAPLAARVRAGTSSTSRSRRASDQLDAIVTQQLSQGVTVAALARAAGVSHRAMSTRAQRAADPNPRPPTPADADAEAEPPAPDAPDAPDQP